MWVLLGSFLSITSSFRINHARSALKLFESQFLLDQDNWDNFDMQFTKHYDSFILQDEVSDELANLQNLDFLKEENNGKDALTNLVDRIATIDPLPLKSDGSDTMQKRVLKGVASALIGKYMAKSGWNERVSINKLKLGSQQWGLFRDTNRKSANPICQMALSTCDENLSVSMLPK